MIIECQKDKDYQESVNWLLNTLSEYGQEGVRAARGGHDGAKTVWERGVMKEVSIHTLKGSLQCTDGC